MVTSDGSIDIPAFGRGVSKNTLLSVRLEGDDVTIVVPPFIAATVTWARTSNR
jgi:hypothetical protein